MAKTTATIYTNSTNMTPSYDGHTWTYYDNTGGASNIPWKPTVAPNTSPYQWPQPNTFPVNPAVGYPTTTVTTPSAPVEGTIINIQGKLYRFSEEKQEWHEIIGAPDESVAAVPEIPITLDASAMLLALREYKDFLESLDGLDAETANVVDDTLFGLKEAIEALEKLG